MQFNSPITYKFVLQEHVVGVNNPDGKEYRTNSCVRVILYYKPDKYTATPIFDGGYILGKLTDAEKEKLKQLLESEESKEWKEEWLKEIENKVDFIKSKIKDVTYQLTDKK